MICGGFKIMILRTYCSLLFNFNHTGCSQSRLNLKQIPLLIVEDQILRLPKPQPAQPLASPEGTAQEGTPLLYLALTMCVCVCMQGVHL